MKKLMNLLILAGISLSWMGCSSKSQIKKTLKDNPEIIFEVIKENPSSFFDTVRDAQMDARKADAKKMAKEEEQKMEEDLKNPKKPDTPEDRAYFGDKNAKITIVEYSDFQCGYCARAHTTMSEILEKYKGKVRVLYKHLPVIGGSKVVAQYYEAVAKVDSSKAKMFHDMLFESKKDIGGGNEKALQKLVKKVGLSVSKVKGQLKKVNKVLEADIEEARKFGFSGTPGFIVGGVVVRGYLNYEDFKKVLDKRLAHKN